MTLAIRVPGFRRRGPRGAAFLSGGLVVGGVLTSAVAGMAVTLYRITRHHGQTLLRLEATENELQHLRATANGLSTTQMDNFTYLYTYGMPPGSMGMNFDLPLVGGGYLAKTQLRGRRFMLIFIGPDCPASMAMLPALARLPAEPLDDEPLVILLASGDIERARAIVDDHDIQVPVVVQDSNEVSMQYYVNNTPAAYLLDAQGITEGRRIDGALAILGVLMSRADDPVAVLDSGLTSVPTAFEPSRAPLKRGERLPELPYTPVRGDVLQGERALGHRRLIVMFDPISTPCVDILPDLIALHRDPAQPDVHLISRRDPALTVNLLDRYDGPFPVSVQRYWDASRLLGVLAVPAACVVAPGGVLETDVAVGQQAIFGLLKQLRAAPAEHRLVSLADVLSA